MNAENVPFVVAVVVRDQQLRAVDGVDCWAPHSFVAYTKVGVESASAIVYQPLWVGVPVCGRLDLWSKAGFMPFLVGGENALWLIFWPDVDEQSWHSFALIQKTRDLLSGEKLG